MIYSGQETCLDRKLKFYIRDTIDWDTCELTPFYRDLIKLKKGNRVLWNGDSGGSMDKIKTNLTKKNVSFKPDLKELEREMYYVF